jgi:NADPH:quinone reductase-like Zn-dependent oxidoreductase
MNFSVLLLGSRLSFASIFVQLAHHWGAKTIVIVRSVAEEQYLGSLNLKSGA